MATILIAGAIIWTAYAVGHWAGWKRGYNEGRRVDYRDPAQFPRSGGDENDPPPYSEKD